MTLGRISLTAGVVVTAATIAMVPFAREAPVPAFAAPHEVEPWPLASGHEQEQRDDALRRANVWRAVDPATADLRSNPPDPTGMLSEPRDGVVRCRFLTTAPHGTTTKFDCVLQDGEVVRVKYGRSGETESEVAASRLLTALGFGTDRMFFVPRLRCYGCPRFPFHAARLLNGLGVRHAVMHMLPDDRFNDFDWVSVERRFPGREIALPEGTPHTVHRGWAWFELDRVDEAATAERRAELDALRLVARFVAHWDNKASNQRLVCLAAGAETCAQPFAIIHDLGATFGPIRINAARWEATHIWADASRCRVSMKDLPYDGGTFPDVQVSEAGRLLAARQLGALSDRQLTDLFETAHFGSFRGWNLRTWPVSEWVRVFREKVHEIQSGGPCPASRPRSS